LPIYQKLSDLDVGAAGRGVGARTTLLSGESSLSPRDTGGRSSAMHKVILADTQAIFRAGTAKVLGSDDEFRIVAQCSDAERMMHAVTTFPASVVIFASSLKAELSRLKVLLDGAGSRGIVIVENSESPQIYLQHGFRGIIFRNTTGASLIECVRRVTAGETWQPLQALLTDDSEADLVGTRVRDRLTPKEMRIVALIVQGCKNREIATRLKTTEQVIKNYLRSIYDKTGVSDRLELALFILHHRVLAEAAADVGNRIDEEEHSGSLATPAIKKASKVQTISRTGT